MTTILPKCAVSWIPGGVLCWPLIHACPRGRPRPPTLTCVASLIELVRAHTDLDEGDIAWLQLLQADWQIIADLSFADLILWLPDRDGQGFWAGGQMRPTTGPTAYVDDIIGTF